MLTFLALAACGYLCGSLSSAVIVCRALGHPDPRAGGSGNPGATNVLRLYGRIPAAVTLAGDVAKGTVPVVVAQLLGAGPATVAAVAASALLGHLYPVFFGFQGGKGVATFMGVLLGLDPRLWLAFALIWVVVAAMFRYSSLAALIAAAANPLVAIALGQPRAVILCIFGMTAVIFWRHRSNMRNLARGTEHRIGARPV